MTTTQMPPIRLVSDRTCPACSYPELGCDILVDGPAPALTCSRCKSSYLATTGAGILLQLLEEASSDTDDEAYRQRLEILDQLIADNTVAFLSPKSMKAGGR